MRSKLTERSNVGVAMLLALVGACEPRPPLPRRGAIAPATQPSRGSIPATSSPATTLAPPRTNCGLTTPAHVELMPVFHQRVVVQKSLGPVKLRGTPRLLAEPEDFAEYYLGESAIDPKTLPTSLQALRGAELHALRGTEDCHARLGAISALAWADEEGSGWSASSSAKNAARVFKKGESFLVAQLDPSCEFFLRGGLVTLNPVDGYRAWDKVIDEYDAQDGSKRRAIFERALATLPEPWPNHPDGYMYWTEATLADASILVLEAAGGPQGAWLGVWCVETDGSLVSLAPGAVPDEHSDAITHYRRHLEVIGREGSLPIILYSYFGLDPSTGRYTYFNPSIGPAPHIEEPTPQRH